ncbi:hypothetical protein BVX98_05485 [bacterium F11]|nr:hypothetical protein BVX98_05485 [bacterium F11]
MNIVRIVVFAILTQLIVAFPVYADGHKKLNTNKMEKVIPSFLFTGEYNQVNIFSNYYEPYINIVNKYDAPCHNINWEKAINKVGKVSDSKIVADNCLFAAGDVVYAHGEGWVEKRTIPKFKITLKDRGTEDTYVFVNGIIQELPDSPLFFTTIPHKKPDNGFSRLSEIENSSINLPAAIKDTLSKLKREGNNTNYYVYNFPSRDIPSYIININSKGVTDLSKTNTDILFIVSDNEADEILNIKSDDFYCVLDEVIIEGILDFDDDGDKDIYLTTPHTKIILENSSGDFNLFRWGFEPCAT